MALVVNESQALRQCLADTPVHRVQLLPDVSQRARHHSSILLGDTKEPARSVDRAVRGPYCRVYYAHDMSPGLPYPASELVLPFLRRAMDVASQDFITLSVVL